MVCASIDFAHHALPTHAPFFHLGHRAGYDASDVGAIRVTASFQPVQSFEL
jgi:hypothetical protein